MLWISCVILLSISTKWRPLQKVRWIFRIVSIWELPSFKQNLTQFHCSLSSDFVLNLENDDSFQDRTKLTKIYGKKNFEAVTSCLTLVKNSWLFVCPKIDESHQIFIHQLKIQKISVSNEQILNHVSAIDEYICGKLNLGLRNSDSICKLRFCLRDW